MGHMHRIAQRVSDVFANPISAATRFCAADRRMGRTKQARRTTRSILDGDSRYIVHWDLREKMTEADIEIIMQGAKEKYPEARQRIISDNGPQLRFELASLRIGRGFTSWWVHF